MKRVAPMMNDIRQPVLLLLAALALQGCVSTTGIGGASAGSLSGEATQAKLLEPLQGGLVAGPLGEGLSAAEKTRAVAAEYRALETGFGQPPAQWADEGTGVRGEVTAGAPYRVGSQDCRAYTHKVVKGGAERVAEGSACRQPDGAWLRLL